jgi:hypothetical protein
VIEDFIDVSNGTTHVETADGVEIGTFTNIVYRNTNDGWRQYDGMLFQARYNVGTNWSVNGHYTLQLNNDGNFEGEGANTPGAPSQLGDYQQAFTAARNYPDGRLNDFQRHKVRLWSIYNHELGRFGDASVSAIWRIDGGTTFSYAATNQAISAIQSAKLAAAGYVDPPTTQTLYFGERGAGQFKGFQVVDLGLGYNIPIVRTLRPWFRFDVYNLLNNQKQLRWNTTVSQDPNSPLDENGLRTGYRQGASFGKATANTDFPVPVIGGTGGRTWRAAVGVRF